MAKRKKLDFETLEGPPPGDLPKAAAEMLRKTFQGAMEQYYGRDKMSLEKAEELASRTAWTQVKRYYYQRGDKWHKRKDPLAQSEYPPGSHPAEYYENPGRRRNQEMTYELPIGYDVFNIFQRYWWGQGDPLYAVLSRRGTSVDWVTVEASEEEVDRMVETAREILEKSSDETERRVADAFLRRFEERFGSVSENNPGYKKLKRKLMR